MADILVRAGCFVAIIILGYVLKKIGVFKEQDFSVLSKVVMKITLPAAIVTSFAGREIDPAMLMLVVLVAGGWWCWCNIYSSSKSVSPEHLLDRHL